MKELLIVAEISISYKPITACRPIIKTAEMAMSAFKPFFDEDLINLQEQFVVMYLSRSNRVLGVYSHSKGGITGTIADIRLILGTALKTAACSIILCHNHPSSNLQPSQADIDLTRRIKEAAAIMDIKVIEHLLINSEFEYYSMAEQGLI